MRYRALFSLFEKDLKAEWRQQQNLMGIFLYALSTIFIIYLATGNPPADQWNALFWITQVFIVVNAVIKSFVGEAQGRMLYYYSTVHPLEYLYSKMLMNVFYMILLSLISLAFFMLFLGNPVQNHLLFIAITLLGGIGLSLLFTMLSAVASKARQQASLVAVLGLPVMVPQLILLIRLSRAGMGEIFKEGGILKIFGLLTGLDILIVIMASILFPFLWKD